MGKINSHIILTFLQFGVLICGARGGQLEIKQIKEVQDVVVVLPSKMDNVLASLKGVNSHQKADQLTQHLKEVTSMAQSPFLQALKEAGVQDHQVQGFWITNKISIRNMTESQLKKFMTLPGDYIIREPIIANLLSMPMLQRNASSSSSRCNIEWSVSRIEAPLVWSKLKNQGESIVVGVIDTGVNPKHEAIKNNYGGKWLDAVDGKPDPYDDQGHGTHVTGTICGSTNGIGVAPRAKWIACKSLDKYGGGDEVNLSTCFQFMLESKPHIVSNSWGGPGGLGDKYFDDEIKAWTAAGIIPVFAIGNSGRSCGTSGYPGNHKDVIGVGATNIDDQMAKFSSRGPTSNGDLKPDISAPGVHILSADSKNDQGYIHLQGTSMSCPSTSGTIALMLSANPKLTFHEVRSILQRTADRPQMKLEECEEGDEEGSYPNHAYGHGRINAYKAVKSSIPGGTLF